MTWSRIESNWTEHAPRVKKRWDKLSDDDVQRIGGKRDELEARLREAYGIAHEDARTQVDEFCRSVQSR